MNYDDFMNLPLERFWQMWKMITVIEAQETLKQFVIADWPNQSKQQREKVHRDIYKKAYPKEFNKPKEMSNEMIEKILRG